MGCIEKKKRASAPCYLSQLIKQLLPHPLSPPPQADIQVTWWEGQKLSPEHLYYIFCTMYFIAIISINSNSSFEVSTCNPYIQAFCGMDVRFFYLLITLLLLLCRVSYQGSAMLYLLIAPNFWLLSPHTGVLALSKISAVHDELKVLVLFHLPHNLLLSILLCPASMCNRTSPW